MAWRSSIGGRFHRSLRRSSTSSPAFSLLLNGGFVDGVVAETTDLAADVSVGRFPDGEGRVRELVSPTSSAFSTESVDTSASGAEGTFICGDADAIGGVNV